MSSGQLSQTFFPWQGTKATVGTWVRFANTTYLGMGWLYQNPIAINNSISWDVWLDSGTWKVAFIASKDGDRGIATVQLNAVSKGTVDLYDAATILNVYSEITGIVVATAGINTLKLLAATKNAGSADYQLVFASIALIKTAGAHTTGGTDTPGYVVEIIPWAGSKANTGWAQQQQDSTHLGGGFLYGALNLNDAVSWDIELDAGTYKYAQVHYRESNNGIYTINLAGVSKGTIDGYAASTTINVYTEVTGIVPTAGVNTFQLLMASKNASSSAYGKRINSSSWVRTGA